MAQLVIATVAEKGGGKGLFIKLVQKLLRDKTVVSVRFSDTWRQILHLLGKEESRENISRLATAIRALFNDEGILVGAMEERLKTIDADVVILDGLRKQEEIALVRKRNGILVYISAGQKVRFYRRREDAETTDERGMSWEQFVRQDELPTEAAIRAIGETMADVTIENNGTVEEFEGEVRNFITRCVAPKLV